jgi:hypothetical protein
VSKFPGSARNIVSSMGGNTCSKMQLQEMLPL